MENYIVETQRLIDRLFVNPDSVDPYRFDGVSYAPQVMDRVMRTPADVVRVIAQAEAVGGMGADDVARAVCVACHRRRPRTNVVCWDRTFWGDELSPWAAMRRLMDIDLLDDVAPQQQMVHASMLILLVGVLVLVPALLGMPLLGWFAAVLHLAGCTGDMAYVRVIAREPMATHVEDTERGISLLHDE